MEHGVSEATYAFGKPLMVCGCGWNTGNCETWEEAGAAFDAHLEESKPEPTCDWIGRLR